MPHHFPIRKWDLLDQKPIAFERGGMNHNNFPNRKAKNLSRRYIIQISALSTFDGRVVAYHGVDG